MQFFDEKMTEELKKRLSKVKEPVSFLLFMTEKDPESNKVMEAFLGQVSELSDKLTVENVIIERDKEKAKEYGICAVPCFAITGEKRQKVLFYGIPMGGEFSTFLLDIVDVSTGKPDIPGDLAEKIRKIEGPLLLQTFVTHTCPHCPAMAKVVHDLAVLNPNIYAEVIDAAQFQPLTQAYKISSVPTTVVNRKMALGGSMALDMLLKKLDDILKK